MTTNVDVTDSGIVVRAAAPTDLLDVHRLERECFANPWPFEAFRRHINSPAFYVAEVDGRVVGYVVGDKRQEFPGPIGHIKDLAVHPHFRRRGIARTILQQALDRLTELGVVRINLEVRIGNEPAISLYRSMGFVPWRRRTGYYPDGETAIVMVRQIR